MAAAAIARWELARPLERERWLDEPQRMITHWLDLNGNGTELQIEGHAATSRSVSIRSVFVTEPDQRIELDAMG